MRAGPPPALSATCGQTRRNIWPPRLSTEGIKPPHRCATPLHPGHILMKIQHFFFVFLTLLFFFFRLSSFKAHFLPIFYSFYVLFAFGIVSSHCWKRALSSTNGAIPPPPPIKHSAARKDQSESDSFRPLYCLGAKVMSEQIPEQFRAPGFGFSIVTIRSYLEQVLLTSRLQFAPVKYFYRMIEVDLSLKLEVSFWIIIYHMVLAVI